MLAAALAAPVEAAGPPQDVVKLRRQVALLKRSNAKLARQVTQLKNAKADLQAQVTDLTTSAASLRSERDTALSDLFNTRSQLAAAQSGVSGAISTMSHEQIWGLFSTIAARYNVPKWSTSYYESGNYKSYSFTYCGFC